MPYRRGEETVHIINLALDGSEREIYALSDAVGLLPGVSVKTTF